MAQRDGRLSMDLGTLLKRLTGKGGFARKSLEVFAIKIASAGLAFVMFAALARAMDVESYGAFATVFSLASLCSDFGSFGQRANVIRYAAQYDEQGAPKLRRGAVRFGYGVVGLGTLLTALAAFGVALLFIDASITPAALAGVIVLALSLGLTDFQSRALRVFASAWLALAPRDIIWRAGICAVALFIAFQYGRLAGTAPFWIWGMGLTLLLAGLAQWLIYEIRFPKTSFRGSSEYAMGPWVRTAGGPWLSLIFTRASVDIAVIIVGQQLELAQAGAFFAALRVAQLLNLFMLAIEVILLPAVSRAIANDDWGQVQRLCKLTAVMGGGFGLLGGLVFLLGGKLLLGVFGPETVQAYPALMVLTLGFVVNTLAGPTAPVMLMSGNGTVLAGFQLIGAVLGLGLMPLATATYGMEGAAACLASSMAFWNLCAWAFARWRLGVDPTIFSLVSTPRRGQGG